MKEYRCTRNAVYAHECLGKNDITARQGHYIKAESQEQAWEKMVAGRDTCKMGHDAKIY